MDNTYDIRTPESAYNTLKNITGITPDIWAEYVCKDYKFDYLEEMISYILDNFMQRELCYDNLNIVFTHITTSANDCMYYNKYGILNLRDAYLNANTELRQFLDKHNIVIDIDRAVLKYDNDYYDISYGEPPHRDTKEYDCWHIGWKLYFDFAVCGFLTLEDDNPYLGRVHARPEFLQDIDNLLNLNLSSLWHDTHRPYAVTAKVCGSKTIYNYDKTESERDRIVRYVTMAYRKAFSSLSEQYVVLKDDAFIPSSDIIEIKPFTLWS